MTLGIAIALTLAAVLVIAGVIVSWRVGVREGGIFVFCGMVALSTAAGMTLNSSSIFSKPSIPFEHNGDVNTASFDKNLTIEVKKDETDGQFVKIIRNRKTGDVVSVVPVKQHEAVPQEEVTSSAPPMSQSRLPFTVIPNEVPEQ